MPVRDVAEPGAAGVTLGRWREVEDGLGAPATEEELVEIAEFRERFVVPFVKVIKRRCGLPSLGRRARTELPARAEQERSFALGAPARHAGHARLAEKPRGLMTPTTDT
jgi:hypothetical protein